MTTMNEKYGDGSDCIVCERCGLCITHGDCKCYGCGKEVQKDNESSASAGSVAFNYVNITTACCEGWINLFFGEKCIACIEDVELAKKIKATIHERVVRQ